MTKVQADRMLVDRFNALNERAESADTSNEELIALTDSMLKVYMMLTNAGSFEDSKIVGNGSGVLN